MSLEVGPVTKSKNGVDMLGLLYCLSTAADNHSHVAEQSTQLSVSPHQE